MHRYFIIGCIYLFILYLDTFITKPFGMEWKTTKADKKNLYVSHIQPHSQAALGNVNIGSKLIAFNGEIIEDLGAKQIYGQLNISEMPLTITFLKPPQSEEDKEGDPNSPQVKSQPVAIEPVFSGSVASIDSPQDNEDKDEPQTPPAPFPPSHIPQTSGGPAMDGNEDDPFQEIGPPPVPQSPSSGKQYEAAQAIIPQVFNDRSEPPINPADSFHAD